MNLLVYDMDPATIQCFQALYEKDHEILFCRSVKEILSSCQSRSLDYIFIGNTLKGAGDAVAAIQDLHKKTQEKVPIIGLMSITGENLLDLQQIDGSFPKPLVLEKLLELLKTGKIDPAPVIEDLQLPIFNQNSAMKICDGDRKLFREILIVFLKDSPKYMDSLKKALADGDTQICQRQAHALKGAAANIAALRLKESAFRMERVSKANDLDKARKLWNSLEKNFNDLNQDLAEIFPTLSSGFQ